MVLPRITLMFTLNVFLDATWNSVWDNVAKVSERTPGGSCLSWRMRLSSPLRIVTTTFINQAGETVIEGKYPIIFFITNFGVTNGSNVSNKVMFGKRQPLSTPLSRKMMYFMSMDTVWISSEFVWKETKKTTFIPQSKILKLILTIFIWSSSVIFFCDVHD